METRTRTNRGDGEDEDEDEDEDDEEDDEEDEDEAAVKEGDEEPLCLVFSRRPRRGSRRMFFDSRRGAVVSFWTAKFGGWDHSFLARIYSLDIMSSQNSSYSLRISPFSSLSQSSRLFRALSYHQR